jgi:hypothetical protein
MVRVGNGSSNEEIPPEKTPAGGWLDELDPTTSWSSSIERAGGDEAGPVIETNSSADRLSGAGGDASSDAGSVAGRVSAVDAEGASGTDGDVSDAGARGPTEGIGTSDWRLGLGVSSSGFGATAAVV